MKKNAILNIFYQIIILAIPLILSPYLSRVLGASGIGEYTTTFTIVTYFCFAAMLGINNYGNRGLAKENDLAKKSEFFWELIIFRAVCTTFLLIIYFVIFIINYSTMAIVQSILLFGAYFDLNWAYYGLEKIKPLVFKNLIIKIITMICIFIFVRNENDLLIYTLIMAISPVVGELLLWPSIIKEFGFCKVKFRNIFVHLKPMFILFIPIFGLTAYRMIDKTMIGLILGNVECGFYESADKIVNLTVQILAALGTVLMPRISNLKSQNRVTEAKSIVKVCLISNIVLCCAMVAGILAISDDFVIVFFGEEFEPTSNILKALSLSLIFSSLSHLIRCGILIPFGMDKQYVWTILIGAFADILLNALFIFIFRTTLSVAIATVISEVIVFILEFLVTRKIFDYKSIVLPFALSICAACMMFACLFCFSFFISISNLILKILIEICIGIFSYFIFCFLLFISFDKKEIIFLKLMLTKRKGDDL
jgi:Membrane protein involved in the export of O-antigen and teichoic acid